MVAGYFFNRIIVIKSTTRTGFRSLGHHVDIAILGGYHVVNHVFIDSLEAQIVVTCIMVAGVACMGGNLPAVSLRDVWLSHIITGRISSVTLGLVNLLF